MGEQFSPTGSNPKAQFRLFLLPVELRIIIYLFVLENTDLHVGPVAYSSNLSAYPSVPYRGACKQMDSEITKLIFQNCKVEFSDDKTFLHYITLNSRFTAQVAQNENLSISKHDDEYSVAVQTCFLARPQFVPQLLKNLDSSTRVATIADVLWASCYKAQFTLASAIVRKLKELNSDARSYERGFCLAVYHGNLGLIQELLDAGADINCQPSYPLDDEVYQSWNQIMCDCGPFRDKEDLHHCFLGMSPLSVACSYRCDKTIAEFLLRNGATLDSAFGLPPCHAAARHGRTEILQWLKTEGADIKKNFDGQNLLHSACDGGDANTVEFLLNQGFNAHELTEKRWTTLTISCRRKFSEVRGNACPTSQLRLVKTILEKGVDVNGVVPHDKTALGLALQYSGNKLLAQYLVESGADMHLHDPLGKCADNSIVSKESKESMLFVIENLDEESRSRVVIKSNDADFRMKLAAFGIKTETTTRLDCTPFDDIPMLRCKRPYS